jgi:7-cyano-7-deazaguanine reductase
MVPKRYIKRRRTQGVKLPTWTLPRLETTLNRYSRNTFVCDHEFPELTALCPITKLPDFYVVALSYQPDTKLVELKSLKLYFVAYRNLEILHEELANKFLEDFVSAVSPRWASVEVKVNNRGGIYTTVRRSWNKRTKSPTLNPSRQPPLGKIR